MLYCRICQVSLCGREESEAMSRHDFFCQVRSVVCGYHIYKRVWTPVLGEQLFTMLRMRIAAIYHLFIKRHLKIIQVAVWRYI